MHPRPDLVPPVAPRPRVELPPVSTVHPAVGLLDTLDDRERRLYDDPDAFASLGDPAEGGWRRRVAEPDQTYEDFLHEAHNPVTTGRQRLYLLPIGSFPTELVVEPATVILVRTPPLPWLGDFLERFFGLPVRLLDPISIEGQELTTRVHRGHEQIDAEGLLSGVASQLPEDAYSMTALLNRDLYTVRQKEYAFGYGMHRERLAVMSFARFDPAFTGAARDDLWWSRLRVRSLKVLVHEVAHTLGLRHCTFFACVLNGFAHPTELDATPLRLCPVCLRKLVDSTAVDPIARYERLAGFFERGGLPEDAAWIEGRLAYIADGARPEGAAFGSSATRATPP